MESYIEEIDQGVFALEADESDAGKRLDVFLSEKIDSVQRTKACRLIEQGDVKVNDTLKKPSYRLKPSDKVSGIVPPPDIVQFAPENIPLDVLYEDREIIVLNKQAGLVVHPAPGHWTGTLVNGLLYHYPDIASGDNDSRPGIVHRLDMDTSGVMIIARNQKALMKLSESFQVRDVRKEYVALVYGRFQQDSGTIDAPIGRHPVDRKRMSVARSGGKKAVTHYHVEQRYHHSTLIRCEIETGRTHQIRVHCHSIHHPVVGDGVYTSRMNVHPARTNQQEMKILASTDRQMLHARRITIQHPSTLETMSFQAPLPADMAIVIEDIQSLSEKIH